MNSGVISSILSFPPAWLRWDSHSLIYYDTYRALQELKPEFGDFIKMKDVFKYDGAYGPDRLWMKGGRATSESYYNPETGQGGALKQIYRQYRDAKERAMQNLPWENDFTWMSHFIVDALSPSHHFGRRVRPIKKYRDWEDPYYFANRPSSLKNRHMIFEATINFWQVFGKRQKPKFDRLEEIKSREVEAFIGAMAVKIKALGLYEEFLKNGFDRALWHRINKELIPKIEYALAVVWWSLFLEIKDGRALINNEN
ncbi:hypothetical protein GYA54_04715 [Candidatus Kuenenbacteria bacterium]|nr:hypothetical protein [Candidatus Kuenenbacteria bacterium]